MIIPTAEPFFFSGGPVGILLIHGFTGTPKELRWMGEDLSKRGYTVLAVRLAGHATNPDDMSRVTWQDWLISVEDGYHLLKGISENIFVAGLSMGAVLALLFASRFEVSGVIAMSTPFQLPPDPRLPFLKTLSWLVPNINKGESDWRDPSLAKDHIDYPAYPTRSVIELMDLINEMRSALPSIKIPVLLIQSLLDKSVPFDHMAKIVDLLKNSETTTLTVKNSGHVVTRDLEKEKVFNATHEFIAKICGVTG